jgi:hypothetical protein
MSLGRKNQDSRVNHVYYVNMSIHRFVSRLYSIEVNFQKLLEVLRHHNQKNTSGDKVKFSAVIMKAIALTYAFRASDGTQPYRRLSGYPPMFAWQKSFQSKTIDISLMLVREFDHEKQQTLNYRFKSVDQQSVAQLSQRLIEIQTQPEDEVDQFRQLKKIARLPRFLLYCFFQLTKIPTIRAQSTAPSSLSILSKFDGQFYGEHISMFTLGKINPDSHTTQLNWSIDHRLGFGIHFEPFFNHLKSLLEDPEFLIKEFSETPNE